MFCSWVHLRVLLCLILGYQRPPLHFFQSPIVACAPSPPQLQRDQPDLSLTLLHPLAIISILMCRKLFYFFTTLHELQLVEDGWWRVGRPDTIRPPLCKRSVTQTSQSTATLHRLAFEYFPRRRCTTAWHTR